MAPFGCAVRTDDEVDAYYQAEIDAFESIDHAQTSQDEADVHYRQSCRG